METEKELNGNILNIILKIKERYLELSKYLEELPITTSSKTGTDVTLKKLSTYYESLNLLVNTYILEQSLKKE
ncbi:MAG: hypothetical protein A3K10_08595 [Bacteroidetes bacterium RIFCSPLOWO2_12_FULL_31_6]|nr:MAG: hypothetical protein A3K10_08595 [Bacteroidetes bacterium RIFCSPLOWO2_12_FULL_31_6]